MDIHKPKPIHNWREFLKEVGIIVLGVCIALAAEQGVEWWHWRSQVQTARQALARELVLNIGNGATRVMGERCAEERFDRAADALDAASRSGMLPPLTEALIATPQYDWPSSTWTSITSSDVASHFSRDEMNALGLVYAQVQFMSRLNEQEVSVWADLSAMVGPGRRLDPSMDTVLHLAVSHGRLLGRLMAINGGQLVQRALALNLPYTEDDRREIAKRIADRRARGCKPRNASTAIPPRYGQAAASDILNALREMQKHPPYTNAK
jgi:hypothetical protein